MTASDPRHVIEEVEENCEADTGKALVTGTDDTTENPDTANQRLLKVLPSPADSERRHMVLSVPRGKIPHSFSQQQAALQLDGLERDHGAVRSMAKWRSAAVRL